MSRHGNRSCFYSPIKCPICPKLHTFDKSHGLKTSTCQCLVIDIAPPAGYRKSNHIKSKSNQINSLLLSHHHSTSALVSENLTSVLQTVQKKKNTTIYIWTVHIYRLYRRQCAKYTYIYSVHTVYYKDILSYQYTLYTVCTHLHYVHIYA